MTEPAAKKRNTGKRERLVSLRPMTPIVPPVNVAGRALMVVIAIMSFLCAITLGAVTMVQEKAEAWQGDVSREITIQIKPDDGLDMEAALIEVRDIVLSFPGAVSAQIVDRASTARLLEPWLGEGFDMDELPVPRLIIVTIDEAAPPDLNAIRQTLADSVPAAALDDHRAWVSRLVTMAKATVLIGAAILALVMIATVLTVVFATRGAMSGNRHIIEVLHFVGARASFIANEFQGHFLRLGLVGAMVGGSAALLVFVLMGEWTRANQATPEADQISALFGSFAIGWTGYIGVVILVATVGGLTALTSRVTVRRQLAAIDMISPVEG